MRAVINRCHKSEQEILILFKMSCRRTFTDCPWGALITGCLLWPVTVAVTGQCEGPANTTQGSKLANSQQTGSTCAKPGTQPQRRPKREILWKCKDFRPSIFPCVSLEVIVKIILTSTDLASNTHSQFFLWSPIIYTSGQMEEEVLWELRMKGRKQD